MQLTCPAFESGGRIPLRFTCDGADASPPLAWSDTPAGTRSFALVCADPDAPRGTWYHWAIYDIPAATHALAEHHSPSGTDPPQAVNDFHRTGYGGPCPPQGPQPHRYRFRLFALDVERLGLGPRVSCRDVEAAATTHALASAEIMGTYRRAHK